MIANGFQCADGAVWWGIDFVQADGSYMRGYVPESVNGKYWMIPTSYIP
jgi:hypothetical protein